MKQGRTILIYAFCALLVLLCIWVVENPDARPTALMRAAAYNNRAWKLAVRATTKEQYEQALADCNQAIERDASLVNSYDTRAYVYAKLGLYQDAIDDTNVAVAKSADKVLTDWNGALSDYPKDAYLYAMRGLVYLELHNQKKAKTDFGKAIELDPKCNVVTYFQMEQASAM
jgi:tetratricopeptide (TPR) repeat protein